MSLNSPYRFEGIGEPDAISAAKVSIELQLAFENFGHAVRIMAPVKCSLYVTACMSLTHIGIRNRKSL